MLVEMIAREIREHRRVKIQAGNTLLLQRVRRHLHRNSRGAQLRELAVQRQSVGSRQAVRGDRGGTP